MNSFSNIQYSSTLPDALHQTPTEFEQGAHLTVRVKLFELRCVSSGQAAIDLMTFLMRLAESGIAMIDMPTAELANHIRKPAHRHRLITTRPPHTPRPEGCPGSPREQLAKSEVLTTRLLSRHQVIGLNGLIPISTPLRPSRFMRSDASRIVRHS